MKLVIWLVYNYYTTVVLKLNTCWLTILISNNYANSGVSITVYLKEEDETQKDKAHSIMYMLEHTKLKEVVKVKALKWLIKETY